MGSVGANSAGGIGGRQGRPTRASYDGVYAPSGILSGGRPAIRRPTSSAPVTAELPCVRPPSTGVSVSGQGRVKERE